MTARLGRIALEVADIDRAVVDFNDLFGFEFTMLEIPAQQLRAAYGEHGIEFVQMTMPGWTPREPGQMQGCCIAVDDVEATRVHLESRGQTVVFQIPLQSGRKEYVFAPIHGIPIMIYQECGYFDVIAQ